MSLEMQMQPMLVGLLVLGGMYLYNQDTDQEKTTCVRNVLALGSIAAALWMWGNLEQVQEYLTKLVSGGKSCPCPKSSVLSTTPTTSPLVGFNRR